MIRTVTWLLVCGFALGGRCGAREEGVDWMVGCSGIWASRDAKKLRFKVNRVDPGSAAEGKVEVGNFIVGAGGKKFGLEQFAKYPKDVRDWFVARAPSNELGEAA